MNAGHNPTDRQKLESDGFKILLVEQDKEAVEQLRGLLIANGYQVAHLDPSAIGSTNDMPTSYDAIIFSEDSACLTLSDLQEVLGLDRRSSFLILLGGSSTVERAVDAMLEGAHAYLTKPVCGKRLLDVLKKGFENQKIFHDIMQMATEVQEVNRQLEQHRKNLLEEKKQLERKTEQLHLLYDLSLTVNASLDREEIVHKVFHHLHQVFQVDWCRVCLFNSHENQDWECVVGSRASGLSAVQSLPLSAQGKSIGVMELTTTAAISKEHRQLLDTIALQVGMALQNANSHELVKHLADQDPLTRLGNRRSFERQLQREFRRYRRYRQDMSLILCDLDRFKEINDRFGHQTGDKVLRHLGRVMLESFRDCDYVARWGGDEFAVILPNTAKEQALLSAERLRQRLRQPVENDGRALIQVSASFGIADTKSCALNKAHDLLALADQALYQGKKAGGDEIRLCQENQQPPSDSCPLWIEAGTPATIAW
ncbi:MAG: diguanylate cyclase [Deltaproteobacteria bacterium]|nr:diguanylate cyclase [Deltaproteobacteria bacterium]MBW2069689.1 diguanylate cyclase [Deltaproteobacteria bacterium]